MSKTNNTAVEEKSLATRAPQTAIAVPDYLKNQLGNTVGSEGVGRDDLLIPRLALAQDGMSPQLKKHSEQFIPGLEAGQMFNSVTGEIYGESVVVVPLFFFKNFIKFKPQGAGGGVDKMYNDVSEIPPAELQFNDGNPPVTTEFKNRMCLLIQEGRRPEPIVVSFKSSGLKTAKKWNSLIRDTNLPAFAKTYTLQSKLKVVGEQSWFLLNVMPGEFVPQEFFAQATAYFNNLQEQGYKVDTTGIEGEGREPGSDDAPAF